MPRYKHRYEFVQNGLKLSARLERKKSSSLSAKKWQMAAEIQQKIWGRRILPPTPALLGLMTISSYSKSPPYMTIKWLPQLIHLLNFLVPNSKILKITPHWHHESFSFIINKYIIVTLCTHVTFIQGCQLSRIECESHTWTLILMLSRQACKILRMNAKHPAKHVKSSLIMET